MSGARMLSRPTRLRPTQRDVHGIRWLISRFGSDRHSVLERQLAMASVFSLSLLMLAIPGLAAQIPGGVIAGATLMLAATAMAFLLHRRRVTLRISVIIPLVDILAVGLLRASTGGSSSVFSILLVLPVVSLGVEPGRPLLWGGPVTIIAMLMPVAFDHAAYSGGQWTRVGFTPFVLGLACLLVSELTRRLRSRIRTVEGLRRDQAILLAAAQDHADASASASSLLRESANQLSSVIDSVTEQAIVATDRSGRIEMFNTGAQRILKIAAHDVLGRSIIDLDWEHDITAAEGDVGPAPSRASKFAALVAGVEPRRPQVGDHSYQPPGRARMLLQVAITARQDAGGQIDGYLFVGTDVTLDREAARMKDEFVNLISHELRTPLSSILGYLELIADDEENPLSEEQLKYLATVDRNANRLLRLVSDLLFTAQVESGGFHLQRESVEVRALVAAALETAAPAAKSRQVVLKMSLPPYPVQVWGDPGRLGQAVDNLVSNAVKFTPSGGRVVMTLATDDDPQPRALIGVADTGMGIPPDELDRLFSRFFRASTATANAVPGVGLGLTITKAIATAHGGEIRVASTVGEGTVFVLDLPLAPTG